MSKLNLALIYGGISSERDVSISGGEQVLDALDKTKYEISVYDPKTDLAKLVNDAERLDVALIILHGPYGEDGTIQGMLELLNIPYQGAGVLGSALAIDKDFSKRLYEMDNLPVPPSVTITKQNPVKTKDIVEKLGLPVFVKPSTSGSSIGLSRADKEEELESAIENAFKLDDTVLVETFIDGIELTCGIIGNNNPEPLPVIEIFPDNPTSTFYDYKAKYTAGATKYICPARISEALSKKAQAIALKAHKTLRLKGYSRSDMILKGDDIYLLETNTIPGMTRTSLLPLAAKTVGISFSELLDRLIELALQKTEDE